MPLDSDTSSAFGWRSDPFRGRRKFHNGVDLRAAYGTEVPTAAPGKVTFAGERGAYGLLVVVEHPNGVETRYAHLSSTAVQPGDSVAAGQTIGRVGSSGRSTGPHLHFEVLLDGKRVNPEQIASARSTASILPPTGLAARSLTAYGRASCHQIQVCKGRCRFHPRTHVPDAPVVVGERRTWSGS